MKVITESRSAVKGSLMSITLALAAIALVLSASTTNAGEARPFQGTVVTTLLGWDSDGNWLYLGTANMQHWGNTTHQSVVALPDLTKKIKDPATGTITVSVGNGDSLQIECIQVWDPAAGAWVGDFQVTGGAGKFESATGSGTLLSLPVESGTVVVTYDGTINY